MFHLRDYATPDIIACLEPLIVKSISSLKPTEVLHAFFAVKTIKDRIDAKSYKIVSARLKQHIDKLSVKELVDLAVVT